MFPRRAAVYFVGAGLIAAGCGNVVVLPGGGGAGGATTSGVTTSGSTGSATSSGGGACAAESDCPGGYACLYSSGVCTPTCAPTDLEPCGQGLVCGACATSSCPGCKDCVSACVPAAPGQCDDHDDCPTGSLCLYKTGQCASACDPMSPACPPDLVCDPWATATCPYCQQAQAACVPPAPP